MNRTSHLILLSLTFGLLSACSNVLRQAPVIEHGQPGSDTRPSPTPSTPAAPDTREDGRLYTVKKGDTLLRLALDHGLNYRDLVSWNNLSNPDDIKVDQVLRLAPPERVAGVQTAPISMPPADTRPVLPAVPKKTAPRGDKRPYSESAMAELQKGEGKAEPKAPEKAELVAPPVAPAAPSIPAAGEDEKLSWMWPSNGKIVATFDEGKNKGIDIAGKAGQQVMAAGAGKVMYAGSGIRGYGNLVIVKHSNSLLSAYAHNRSIVVKEGDTVNKGQTIAEMGDSDADSVKLHFEIRQQGKPVDPSRFLPSR
ncbi:MAG: peptidoglycan DD-metalloendopeptidase family protein [Pseudomonadota bacterium]